MSTSSQDFAPACHGMHLPLRDLARENTWENSKRVLHRVILLTPTTIFSKIRYCCINTGIYTHCTYGMNLPDQLPIGGSYRFFYSIKLATAKPNPVNLSLSCPLPIRAPDVCAASGCITEWYWMTWSWWIKNSKFPNQKISEKGNIQKP